MLNMKDKTWIKKWHSSKQTEKDSEKEEHFQNITNWKLGRGEKNRNCEEGVKEFRKIRNWD